MEETQTILTTLLGYGPSGALLAAAFLFSKMHINQIIKSVKTFIETQEKSSLELITSSEKTDKLLSTMISLQTKYSEDFVNHSKEDSKQFTEFNNNLLKMQDIIKDLKTSTSGNLSDLQVSNLIGVYSGKVHAQLLLWFDIRSKHNHILETPHLVKQRYTDRFFEAITKWNSELSQFRYMGLPLDRFDGGGLAKMYSEIFRILYETQLSVARGQEPPYKVDQLQDYLDRKQSILMSAARAWCSSGKTLLESLYDQDGSDKINDVEWMTDEATGFSKSDPSSRKYSPFGEK